jgi:hypothetical protein
MEDSNRAQGKHDLGMPETQATFPSIWSYGCINVQRDASCPIFIPSTDRHLDTDEHSLTIACISKLPNRLALFSRLPQQG